ncbi:hypothetical protein [Rhizobium favelukesii]|uniref:hypothetical protein n=1 Tax=Rhizobium favelukesii TaxID=348824 RepID=UPI000A48C6F4|nr:hypothetical protein [Rhizobium favelukesii]MCS0459949.1 hypothetical protein [Rhizobium favelukesii]
MQAEQANTQRIQLPRSLIGRRHTFQFSWKFEVGQAVKFHDVRAIVTGRRCSALGRQLYEIAMDCADRPHRTVRGEYLVATDEHRDTTHIHVNSVSPAGWKVLLLQPLHDDILRAA